ncbi:MAG: PilZ domain-containing protein [Cyanobium sp.]
MQPPTGKPPLPSPAPPPAGPPPTDGEGLQPRLNRRSPLPEESPGRMVLPSLQSVYVTLHDISRGGCRVVRKGSLALQPGDQVRIEIWREDISSKISLPATIRWVQSYEEATHAGLAFVDHSIKTQRMVDDYLRRSFQGGA